MDWGVAWKAYITHTAPGLSRYGVEKDVVRGEESWSLLKGAQEGTRPAGIRHAMHVCQMKRSQDRQDQIATLAAAGCERLAGTRFAVARKVKRDDSMPRSHKGRPEACEECRATVLAKAMNAEDWLAVCWTHRVQAKTH